MMGFGESVKTCFVRKYATMQGRACRSEYWWFFLFQYVVQILVNTIGAGVGLSVVFSGVAAGGEASLKALPITAFVAMYLPMLITMLVFFAPNLCAAVRRLHDRNRTGWWLIAPIFPCVGVFVGMILLCVAAALRKTGGVGVPILGASGAIVCFIGILAFYACAIWMIVWFALPGTKGANRFGPDPLAPPVG